MLQIYLLSFTQFITGLGWVSRFYFCRLIYHFTGSASFTFIISSNITNKTYFIYFSYTRLCFIAVFLIQNIFIILLYLLLFYYICYYFHHERLLISLQPRFKQWNKIL